jgi:hypothetical protein
MSTDAVTHAARKRLKRYLIWPAWLPHAAYALAVAGCPAALLSLMLWKLRLAALAVGCIALGSLIVWIYRLFVASQKEFDAIAESDYVRVQALALASFGLEPSQLRHPAPCKFRSVSQLAPRPVGDPFRGVRIGTDEKPRRSPVDYAVVNFGLSNMFVFRCTMDLTTGNPVHEDKYEIAYRDMASVESTVERDTLKVGFFRGNHELLRMWKPLGVKRINGVLQLDGAQTLSVRLNNGEHLPIAAWKGHGLGVPSGEGRKSTASALELQRILREIKQGSARKQPEPAAGPVIRRLQGT